MINKLKIIGNYVEQNEGDANPLELNRELREANVILLDFKLQDEECSYIGADTIEFDQNKNQYLLYRNAPARTQSPFPTYSVFYGKDSADCAKNLDKSYKKFLVTLKDNVELNRDLQPLVEIVSNDQITADIKHDILERATPDKSNLFSIRLNQDLIGQSEFFTPVINAFQASRDESYYTGYGKKSLGRDVQCYVCGSKAEKVYGFCNTFNFYSANEEAYIAGGFRKEKMWANYPVCPQCAKHLRIGAERVNAAFNRYFYGTSYLLIPAPTLDRADFYTTLLDLEEELKELSLAQKEETNQNLRQALEDDILNILSKQNDQLTFTFFFYAASNSEFKILQEAEDILPSRFKKILQAKASVEAYKEFKELPMLQKGRKVDLKFNFGIIRTFFPSKFNNDFIDITAKILKGQPVQRSFVLHNIVEHLSSGFRNDALYQDVLKAQIFIKFLIKLNLIQNPAGKMEVLMDNKYETYFTEHAEFYNADWKKAVFLSGVLVQHLMDIQFRERGAAPFRSRLNGLKLDHRAIRRLFPETVEKLEQYKANYYRDLEGILARLLQSGDPELRHQSVDEISFYFALGMHLNKQFKSDSRGEENE